MICGIKNLFNYKISIGNRNISTSLECFVKRDGKYLMLHRNPDKRIMPNVWMAPGGRREFNEGLLECARREILEGTGLKIKNLQVRATEVAYMKDIDLELFFHFLTADYAGGNLKQESEDGKLVWLTPKEIMGLGNLLSELREVLPHVFGDDQKVISYRAVYEKGNEIVEFELEKPD